MDTLQIKETITKNYVHGAFNETNIEAFKTIFHPEFAILNPQPDGKLFVFTRSMWLDVLEKRKLDKSFDYSSIAFKPLFRNIDVVNDKASVTLELYLGEKLVYTDFLLLAKMDGEWKIVSKIFYQH
jgi:hypothetical protein